MVLFLYDIASVNKMYSVARLETTAEVKGHAWRCQVSFKKTSVVPCMAYRSHLQRPPFPQKWTAVWINNTNSITKYEIKIYTKHLRLLGFLDFLSPDFELRATTGTLKELQPSAYYQTRTTKTAVKKKLTKLIPCSLYWDVNRFNKYICSSLRTILRAQSTSCSHWRWVA